MSGCVLDPAQAEEPASCHCTHPDVLRPHALVEGQRLVELLHQRVRLAREPPSPQLLGPRLRRCLCRYCLSSRSRSCREGQACQAVIVPNMTSNPKRGGAVSCLAGRPGGLEPCAVASVGCAGSSAPSGGPHAAFVSDAPAGRGRSSAPQADADGSSRAAGARCKRYLHRRFSGAPSPAMGAVLMQV